MLVEVDPRGGLSERGAGAGLTRLDLLVRLEEVRQSWAVVALLGSAYGAQVRIAIAEEVAALDKWHWVSALARRRCVCVANVLLMCC
jgi:hypothetical protein